MFATHSGPHGNGIAGDYKKKEGTTVAVRQCEERWQPQKWGVMVTIQVQKKKKKERESWSKKKNKINDNNRAGNDWVRRKRSKQNTPKQNPTKQNLWRCWNGLSAAWVTRQDPNFWPERVEGLRMWVTLFTGRKWELSELKPVKPLTWPISVFSLNSC